MEMLKDSLKKTLGKIESKESSKVGMVKVNQTGLVNVKLVTGKDIDFGLAKLACISKKIRFTEDDEPVIALFHDMLKDIPADKFKKGINKLIQLQKEVFESSNIIALIREASLIDDDMYPTNGEAWEMVLNEMPRCGGIYGVPNIQNKLVQEAVNQLGWKDICLSENLSFTRNSFFKIYEELVSRDKKKKILGE